ncbi:unnamed protein product [Alternaria alternata]
MTEVGTRLLWRVSLSLEVEDRKTNLMEGAAIDVMADLGRPTTNTTLSESENSTEASKIDLNHNLWLLGVTVGVPFFAGAVLGLIITDPIARILRFGRRESPRWLLKESGANEGHENADLRRHNLVRKAFLALLDLRGEPVPILVAGELYLLHTRLIEEQRRLEKDLPGIFPAPAPLNDADRPHIALIEHISWRSRVQLMFFKRGSTRRAHLAAAAVMISQQLCGINLLGFLADTFFKYSIFHNSENISTGQKQVLLGSSVALMGVNFISTIGALFFIDRGNGRRTLLNWSFPCMAISLLGSALVLSGSHGELSSGVIAGHYTFLILFITAYSVGEGPAAFVVSAEVFPLVNRELGMSLAVFWNFLGAGLLAVVAPALWKALGQQGVLLLFVGTNLFAWFICNWLVPNTGNEDLEDVFEQLEVETGFLLQYTLSTLFRRVTKPLEWCLHLGSKSWTNCGYGRKLRSRRAEFLEHQRRNGSTRPTEEHRSEGLEMMQGQ